MYGGSLYYSFYFSVYLTIFIKQKEKKNIKNNQCNRQVPGPVPRTGWLPSLRMAHQSHPAPSLLGDLEIICTSYADAGMACDRAWQDMHPKLVFSVLQLKRGETNSQTILGIRIFSKLPLTVNTFALLSSSPRSCTQSSPSDGKAERRSHRGQSLRHVNTL